MGSWNGPWPFQLGNHQGTVYFSSSARTASVTEYISRTLSSDTTCPGNAKYLNVSPSLTSLRKKIWASLVAQWLRIHLPMQGTQVQASVWEDPTCCGATKPMCHNYWACALEPTSRSYWAHAPRARAPQREKPPQWKAHAPQQRVAPAHRN